METLSTAMTANSTEAKHLKSLQLLSNNYQHRLQCDKEKAANILSHRYEQLLRADKYFDCIFHFGTNTAAVGSVSTESTITIKCHKLILSAASPVFEAMFYGPICEKRSEIEILDISGEIFKIFIDYIYIGTIDFEHLTLEQVIELYYAAEKYLLGELKDDCLKAVKQKLRFSNILPALELSVCMDFCELLNVCLQFFQRCCLCDPQFGAYLMAHYYHISRECLKTLIDASRMSAKQMTSFVREWLQHECDELGGLQENERVLLIDDMELNEILGVKNSGGVLDQYHTQQQQQQQQYISIERCYFKACRPFIVDADTHEWKLIVKCDYFISLFGLIMHSRLTPTLAPLHVTAHQPLHFVPSNEYDENLRVEISVRGGGGGGGSGGSAHPQSVASVSNSDGEESDPEIGGEHDEHHAYAEDSAGNKLIWCYSVKRQTTKYNCDLSVRWNEGVTLAPDVEYQLKVIWPAIAYGAEYPCSLQSNCVNGIQFRDAEAHCGSPIKGLRFLNLV